MKEVRVPVPVNIITGYLGSGKTTLLKKIIKDSKEKIAVLMNEFGEIGIDTKTIQGDNIDIKELLGGCVCCSLTGEFMVAIKEILEKVDPDRIIIETTGVAEPDAMITNVDEIEGVVLDSVVTIVDADAMAKFPSLGHTGRMQIESANILILNKVDLVSTEKIREIENSVREVNSGAKMIRTTYSNVDVKSLYGVRPEIVKREHQKHQTSSIDSFVYRSEKMINKPVFLKMVSDLPREVYRAKGHVKFTDGVYSFNFVNGRYDMSKSGEEKNEIVFIGEGISDSREKIMKAIRSSEM